MKSLGIKQFIYARVADIVSLLHLAIVIIAAFGWWLLPQNPLHFLILVLTLASWVITGSCILARLEIQIRKKYLQVVPDYEHGYLHYHMRHLTGYAPSLTFIRTWGIIYLGVGSILWIVGVYGEALMVL